MSHSMELHAMILRRTTVRTSRSFVTGLVGALAMAALAFASPDALAQEEAQGRAQDEAPSRVGRVADIGGQLFLAPDERATEWAPIELNYPVTSGDNLWLSGDGRAEVDFGVAQLRIAGNSNVHVSRLDEHELSLFVAQGRAIVALRVLEQGDSARIDTPNTQVELTRPGLYRIDVSDDREETTVIVREGEADVAVTGGMQQVLPGQTARVTGTTDVRADVRNGSGVDGFDTWSATRDRYYVRSRTATYVSSEMVGAADLDEYGTWQTYPDYGAVWFPTTVAVGWAPYRYGHWVSIPVWGWTWVDYAPWGYAPFHYGRWAHIRGRWGWCPGTYVRRPAWAPALVAWYGGSRWGVSVSGGGPVYGWVPLGWREPYVPSWRNCGSRCWSAYNRPYAVNPGERDRRPTTYVNHAVPGAITAVGGAAFAGGKPVAPNMVHVPPTLAAAAPVLGAAPPPVKPLPVTANVVRPGNGVPAPASTIQARTKPMIVSPPRAGGAANAGSTNAGPANVPRGRPSATPAPVPGTITAAPPGRPAATPAPAPGAATGQPPPRLQPQAAQEPPHGRAPAMRREGAPLPAAQPGPPQSAPQVVAPRPAPQGLPKPRPSPQAAPAPQVVPQPHTAPAPVPQPHAGPAPVPQPHTNAPPHPEPPQGRGPDKPAPGKPQPVAN